MVSSVVCSVSREDGLGWSVMFYFIFYLMLNYALAATLLDLRSVGLDGFLLSTKLFIVLMPISRFQPGEREKRSLATVDVCV